MKNLTILCDRFEGCRRASVWHGQALLDLYVEKLDKPDMSGAVVSGKVVRVSSASKAAWIDAGLAEHLYLDKAVGVKAGAWVCAQILSTREEGKAWPARLASLEEVQEKKILQNPPTCLEKAIFGLKSGTKASLVVADKQDVVDEAQHDPKHPLLDRLEEIFPTLLSPQVPLKGDSNLIIEPTRALVAIDINAPQTANASAVNIEAVREVLRQIRLRNLSGIIVIDCLKMKERADAAKLANAATRVAQEDPVTIRIGGLSKFGLLELTRQRTGPSLFELFGAGNTL